ncbi:Cut9-interacting protein scn1 [Elasticomyces elasticus]|nr:Cut9-interacting protein scn1 [Elasticomyces elasticus]
MAQEEPRAQPLPWHLGVFDAHSHPTDVLASLQAIPGIKARVLTVMATREQDQQLVADAARQVGVNENDAQSANASDWSEDHKLIPAFGWHPWFSHQMFDESGYGGSTSLSDDQRVSHYQSVLTPKSDDREFLLSLPTPRPFRHYLAQTKAYLTEFPLALIGEVGLDRSFRIPESWLPDQSHERDNALTPGGREGRQLSQYRVSMDHQRKVLQAQLRLAGEMQRAVSLHGVAAHGAVHDTVAETWKGRERHVPSKRERKREEAATKAQSGPPDTNEDASTLPALSGAQPYPPRICLHSYSGPAETVKLYTAPHVPCEVFFSFSTTINAWIEAVGDKNGKVETAVLAVPDDRILVESDLHTAGDRMDGYLEAGVRKICEVKGWELEDGVRRLGRNWKRFVFGHDGW